MKKAIVVLEVEGGSDKHFDGHRRDTTPIVNAIIDAGWHCEVVYYRPEWSEELLKYISVNFDAYISRANQGAIPGGERRYFDLLNRLSATGVVGMPTPVEMVAYGAKDALVNLNDTSLVPSDTAAYYDVDSFHRSFPTSLSFGQRVLKQNRGASGSGVWRVRLQDENLATSLLPGMAVPLDTKILCTEAVDNHTEVRELGEFMDFCDQYIIGDGGLLVDMRFLPRVVEGEIRILMVGSRPIFVVHKKPVEGVDNFSATRFSGATYTYGTPEEWSTLIDMFVEILPDIASRLGGDNIPLIWTADFLLDSGPDGYDDYVLSEFNCFCVGFHTELDRGIQEMIAAEAIARVEQLYR